MRKVLVLIAIGFTMLVLLGVTLVGARYVLSPAPILQIGTLLNLYGRPLIALLIAIVLAARFADVWTSRATLNPASSSRMASFAQALGITLIAIGIVLLIAVLVLNFAIPRQHRGEIPLFFLFGPLLAFIPFGYFTFEIGLSMSRDRAT
jgi:hypothetical protein